MAIIECDLTKLREDSNWEEVFKDSYATPVIFSDVSGTAFDRSGVDKVIASVEGENDEEAWLMVGKLKDGRYFRINASCDYTGWG